MTRNEDLFFELFREWSRHTRFLQLSALAIDDGKVPTIINAQIFAFSASTQPKFNERFGSSRAFARREAINPSESVIGAFIDSAMSGKIVWPSDGTTWRLPPGRDALRITASPFHHPALSPDFRLPTLSIESESKFDTIHRGGGLTELDWSLRSSFPPFSSLDELAVAIGLPSFSSMSGSSRIEFLLTPPVIVAKDLSHILNDICVVRCRAAPTVLTKDVVLTMRQLGPAGSTKTGRLEFMNESDEGDNRVLTFHGSAQGSSAVRVFLSYMDAALDQYWISDPAKALHPRASVHDVFDQNRKFLTETLLSPQLDRQEDFEAAVSFLLHLLGFSVSYLGSASKLSDAPDLVATTARGNLLVVECTLRDPDNKDKLGKAARRAAMLREKLSFAGLGHLEVLACVVTPLTNNELQPYRDDAQKKGVLIGGQDSLSQLLRRLVVPTDSDALFVEAKTLLTSPSGSPLGK